ncbi:MAG: cytochrome c oxidase accessory protein CcoG [Myxococcota bacterium]
MSRKWVYPASVKGKFQKLHRVTGVLLQAFLFVTPWVMVSGRPAVQIDIPARRVFALGSIYTASDAIFLVLALLTALFALFLVTALWGRLWCGFACPQTVFLEEWVRPIETWIEGERGVRMARAKAPWAWKNLWRRVAKLSVFAALAVFASMTAVSWFAGARALWTGQSGLAAYVVMGILAAVVFADFAWFREQFCTYVCPYARFQGALTDGGSYTVQYEVSLGEPRAKPRAAARAAAPAIGAPVPPVTVAPNYALTPAGPVAVGACIDCGKCVAVCPQGIDIREGFQLECIACFRCVDACEGVMAKQGHANLITYAPLERSEGKIRPRTVAYGALLTGLCTAMVLLLATHAELQASVARAPGTMFVVDADGWTRNTYLLKVVNTSLAAEEAVVHTDGLPTDADVRVSSVRLEPAGTTTVPVVVRVRAPDGPSTPLTFTIVTDDARVVLPATFTAGG